MPNSSLLDRVFSLSPHVEMIGRRVYWKHVSLLRKLSGKARKKKNGENTRLDFSKIEEFLKYQGVGEGDLLLVHSAAGPLTSPEFGPSDILNRLIALVGNSGTLAMPAMPRFRNSVGAKNYLTAGCAEEVYIYDVNSTHISTGVLPQLLLKTPGSVRSRHPINSMVALGPLAKELMKNNLVGESSLPCGTESSWKKCVDNGAYILGIGTDLTHSLTMIHVAEDSWADTWPVRNWYLKKNYIVRDGDKSEEYSLRERKTKWGALHFAERTLCRDLIESGMLRSTIIDGVIVEIIESRKLIGFLRDRNGGGYPYYWLTL